jgi:hypothetical protein
MATIEIFKKKLGGKIFKLIQILNLFGGGGGIRTPERVAPLPVFKTGAFNHSATPPAFLIIQSKNIQISLSNKIYI